MNSLILAPLVFVPVFFSHRRNKQLLSVWSGQGLIVGWTWWGLIPTKKSKERSTWVWSFWKTPKRACCVVKSLKPGKTKNYLLLWSSGKQKLMSPYVYSFRDEGFSKREMNRAWKWTSMFLVPEIRVDRSNCVKWKCAVFFSFLVCLVILTVMYGGLNMT